MTVPTAPASRRAAGRLDKAVAALRTGHVARAVDDIMGTGCDMVALADSVTVSAAVSLVRYGSGFICATVDEQACRRLELPPACWRDDSDRWYAGSMRVSVDSTFGITTGISARDRATTLRVLADAFATPGALRRPGHVIPVLAEHRPSNRPSILAATAELCGRAGTSMAFCAVVDDTALSGIPSFNYSDVVRAAESAVDGRVR